MFVFFPHGKCLATGRDWFFLPRWNILWLTPFSPLFHFLDFFFCDYLFFKQQHFGKRNRRHYDVWWLWNGPSPAFRLRRVRMIHTRLSHQWRTQKNLHLGSFKCLWMCLTFFTEVLYSGCWRKPCKYLWVDFPDHYNAAAAQFKYDCWTLSSQNCKQIVEYFYEPQ